MVFFIFIKFFNANSGDPDQTLHCAASDLGLYCLPLVSEEKLFKFYNIHT